MNLNPGSGGATTFSALTDKATVDLPTVNNPLATALAGKASLASPTFTGTVTAGGFAGPLTGNVTGNADTVTGIAIGGTIDTSYSGGAINTNSNGGSIDTSNIGGYISTNYGGSIDTSGGGGAIITSNGGGEINTSGLPLDFFTGGNINTSAGGSGNGGHINTSNSGAAIVTTGSLYAAAGSLFAHNGAGAMVPTNPANLTIGTATAALGIKTATTTVGVSAAAAPSAGQVLTATSSTLATWQTPSSGAAAAGTLTGATLASNVTGSSLTSTGTLTGGATGAGFTVALNTATITGTIPTANTAALTGDVTKSAGSNATTVAKINGTELSTLATGILKNTTTTGVPSIAVAADFPTLNQSTTGSAATITTARNINGVPFNGSADITVTADASTLTGTTLPALVGSALTALNGSSITSGIVALGVGGTGTTNGSITPIGNYTITQNSLAVFTAEATSAEVNTLYLKQGRVGIGRVPDLSGPNRPPLQVVRNGVIGQIYLANQIAGGDTTSGIVMGHYNTGWLAVTLFEGLSTASANTIGIGGGNPGTPAATQLNFYTGSNTTTTTGTIRMSISSAGVVSVPGTLAVTGASTFADNIICSTVGKGLQLKGGSALARAGNATLVTGAVTVANTTVTANTVIILTRKSSGGTIGMAVTYTLNPGTSFSINSDSALDTSVYSYMLIEVTP